MLKSVTITGADDNTNVRDLLALSGDFPFVEWGILVSKNREGSPRYPSREWQNDFMQSAFYSDLNVSMHVCGNWSRMFFESKESPWDRLPPVKFCARRIQINGAASEIKMCGGNLSKHLRDISKRERAMDFIFQVPNGLDAIRHTYGDSINTYALFDGSGGHGQSPAIWEAPVGGITISCAGRRYVGYAGGISADNAEEQIERIENVCSDDFWIDMEGRVRTSDDRLDLDAVRRVLEIAYTHKMCKNQLFSVDSAGEKSINI